MNQSNISVSNGFVPVTGFTWQNYFRFCLCAFGIVLNTASICAFLSLSLKETTYKYMLAKSIIGWFYMVTTLITETTTGCATCDFASTYASRFLSVYVGIYVASCLAIYRILVDITISLQIYTILINKEWNKKYTHLVVLAALLVFSILFNFQKLFVINIVQLPGRSDAFIYTFSLFGLSEMNRILNLVQSLFRIVTSVVVLGLINFVNMVLFKRRYRNRAIGTGVTTIHVKSSINMKFFICLF